MSKKRNLTAATLKKYKSIVDVWFTNDFNGTQAYKKFYSRVKDETAAANFSKIQKLPEIAEYIKEKHSEAAIIVKTTHEGILQELVNWVSSDITQTLNLTSEQLKELPIEYKRLIKKYDQTLTHVRNSKGQIVETIERIKVEFVSKERAIDMINRHVGFYEADNAQKAAVIQITTRNEKQKAIVDGILNSS